MTVKSTTTFGPVEATRRNGFPEGAGTILPAVLPTSECGVRNSRESHRDAASPLWISRFHDAGGTPRRQHSHEHPGDARYSRGHHRCRPVAPSSVRTEIFRTSVTDFPVKKLKGIRILISSTGRLVY